MNKVLRNRTLGLMILPLPPLPSEGHNYPRCVLRPKVVDFNPKTGDADGGD